VKGLFVPVILGTARPGRRSEAVAQHVVDVIKRRDASTQLIDVADFGLVATATPGRGLDLAVYQEMMEDADGVVVVAPEYNHGYPGELKLLLDIESHSYRRKPVGIVSVSSGLLGGARMAEQLRLVTGALGMVTVTPSVHVTNVADATEGDGDLFPPSLQAVLETMLGEVEWYAARLRGGETPPS
jgi:NAD(P)H-dependent FMN reductase